MIPPAGLPAQTVTGPLPNPPGEVELVVNFSTSAAGSLRCEIQDADGEPIPGFTLPIATNIVATRSNTH